MPSNTPTTSTPTADAPTVPRLGLTREEAAEAIGVSPRTIDALIADRTSGFPVVRIGARVIIPVQGLNDWLALRMKGGTP